MSDKNRKLSAKGAKIVGALTELRDALEGGARIDDVFTVRTVELDLQPRAFGPDEVVEVRKLLGLSQALFARFLGVDVKTVCSWEQGVRPPSAIARRFMDEIEQAPEYWKNRVLQAMRTKDRREP